jgi:hypothetical protein
MHSDRIAYHGENRRNAGVFGMQRGHGCVALCEENVRLQGKQLAGVFPRQVGITAGYSILDLEILSRNPPALFESRFENSLAVWVRDEHS